MFHHGYLPGEIDHINNIKMDNRIENLREADRSRNCMNKNITKSNKTGFKGVSWFKKSKKYRAQIQINGKPKHLGLYNCPKEAHLSYCKAALERDAEFAKFG